MKIWTPAIAVFSSVAASTTHYFRHSGPVAGFETVEARAQTPTRVSGSYSNLWVDVLTNDRAASTYRFRVNTGDGNQSISITGSTTGEFQDTTNIDTVAPGDVTNIRLVTGAGGTTFTHISASVAFNPNVSIQGRVSCSAEFTPTASTTYFDPLSGFANTATSPAEAAVSTTIRSSATLKNMAASIRANARTTTTTLGSRINSGNGNLVLSVTAAATGLFEDTSNTDAVVSGNTINLYHTAGTGAGTFDAPIFGLEILSSSSSFLLQSAHASGGQGGVAAGATEYFAIAGWLNNNTTEANLRADALSTFTASRLQAYLTANAVLATSTVNLRIDGVNGNQALSISTLATGFFEDTTNTDSIAPGEELNYAVSAGAGGTSITLTLIGIQAQTPLIPIVMHDYRRLRVA